MTVIALAMLDAAKVGAELISSPRATVSALCGPNPDLLNSDDGKKWNSQQLR